MFRKFLFFVLLSMPFVTLAQTTTTSPANDTTDNGSVHLGRSSCASVEAEMKKIMDFSAAPAWKRIKIKTGKFSVEMPYNEAWRMNEQTVLPYTPLEDQSNIRVKDTSTGYDSNRVKGIHFGAFSLKGICHGTGDISPIESAAMSFREFLVTWEPKRSLALVAKDSGFFNVKPRSYTIKIGKWNGIITHADIAGCVTEGLVVQLPDKNVSISSPCRPLNFNHFRIANSLKTER